MLLNSWVRLYGQRATHIGCFDRWMILTLFHSSYPHVGHNVSTIPAICCEGRYSNFVPEKETLSLSTTENRPVSFLLTCHNWPNQYPSYSLSSSFEYKSVYHWNGDFDCLMYCFPFEKKQERVLKAGGWAVPPVMGIKVAVFRMHFLSLIIMCTWSIPKPGTNMVPLRSSQNSGTTADMVLYLRDITHSLWCSIVKAPYSR